MIKLNCFLVAEYAGVTSDGKLTIAGTFDSLTVQRLPGTPNVPINAVPFAHAYLVAVTEASIADGLTHQFRLRVLNGNGQPILPDQALPVQYSLNAFGRPMRNNMIVSLTGLVFPGADDYVFELSAANQPGLLGELEFAVIVK